MPTKDGKTIHEINGEHYVKGLSFSHYTGTQRSNIACSMSLAKMKMEEGNTEEAQEWLSYGIESINKLTQKLEDLDNLNEMESD